MAQFTDEERALATEFLNRESTTDEERVLAQEILSRTQPVGEPLSIQQQLRTQEQRGPQIGLNPQIFRGLEKEQRAEEARVEALRKDLAFIGSPRISLAEDAKQVRKELPTNWEIMKKETASNAFDALAARGVQFNYITARALGFTDAEIANKAKGPATTQRERVLGEMQQFATDPTSPVSTHPLGFLFGLAHELGTGGRAKSKEFEAQAAKLRQSLPRNDYTKGFLTQSFRDTVPNIGPMAASMGLSIATGNPMIGLAMMGEMEHGDAFFTQLEGDPNRSIVKASLIAGLSEMAELGTEIMVFPGIFKGVTKGVSIQRGVALVMENATQEGGASFMQTYLQEFGLLTSGGMDKGEAASKAYAAGVKSVPQGMWVGALISGGTLSASGVTHSVLDGASKARKAIGGDVSRAPGATTEEYTMVDSFPQARSSKVANTQPILDPFMESRSNKTAAVDTQRDVAEGRGLDDTVKPSDVLAAETIDDVVARAEKNVAKKIDKAFIDQNPAEVERLANTLPEGSRTRDEGLHAAFVLKGKLGTQETVQLPEQIVDILRPEQGEAVTPEAEAAQARISLFESDKNVKISREDSARVLEALQDRISKKKKLADIIREAPTKIREEDLKEITDEEIEETLTELKVKPTTPLIEEGKAKAAREELARKTAFQIKKLQGELGLSEKEYRQALYESTEKNSTTAMSIAEMEKVLTDLNFKKSKKYLTDEPVRLKLTERDLSEIKGSVENIGDDIWRTVLTNQQYALPEDPFSHKKMFNVLKTKVRKQQDFARRQFNKSSANAMTNTWAHAAEDSANFFGDFSSYRNFFSDLDQQTGIPVFGRYQNLIDSSATAKADAQRAFSNVLELHGMTKMPQFSKLRPGDFATVNRLNKALYFSPPEGMNVDDMSAEQLEAIQIRKSFTPAEQTHFDTLKDLFNSDPSRPNTGPNAVRLRGYQWRVWNRAYNEMTPQISEAEASIELDTRQLNNLLAGNENLQQRMSRLIEVDEQIFKTTQTAEGLGEFAESLRKKEAVKPPTPEAVGLVTQPFKRAKDTEGFPVQRGKVDGIEVTLFRDTDQFTHAAWSSTEDVPLLGIKALETLGFTSADAIETIQQNQKRLAEDLAKEEPVEIKGLEKKTPSQADQVTMALLIQERQALEKEISQLEKALPSVEKKRISGLKRKISKTTENISKWQKNIKDATPVTSKIVNGKRKKVLTDPKVLQAGKKAQQEGRLYDWLGRETFGTKEIYFVGQDAFDTWFKSVADSMKPGELGLTQRPHTAGISDTATRSRIKTGDPILNKNPYSVARQRLTKLSLLDELYSPINDMNTDIQKAWNNMSSGQTKAYAAWMDNMVGVYTDPGKVVKALQGIQKQWWRAYGWNPQRLAKFWARNLGQITLVSSQVSVPRFVSAAPVGYASFHMQARATKIQQQGQTTELDKTDMQDLQNELRTAINNSKDRSTSVMDPWLYEDWRQFAATEVSQKAAQYALLTQQESTRTGTGDTNWQDSLPSLLGVSDTMGRWATWVPLHQMAYSNLKALREGKIQDKQLWSRLSLDTLENPQKDVLMVLKENGQDRQFIRKYANMKTKNVHYAYDLNERTPVEQSAASRSILGVITWPRSAMENYVRLNKNAIDGLHEGDMQKVRQATAGIIKYLAGFGVLGVLTAKTGRDPWYGIWRSINPVGFVGSPQLSHLEETAQILSNVWDGDLNNVPSDEKWEAVISELIDKGGTLALPAAVGVLEGWKTMVEARHGLKGVKTVDLMQSVLRGKGELYMGSEEAWRTNEEKWLKFFFNEEKQETRDVRRIPGL